MVAILIVVAGAGFTAYHVLATGKGGSPPTPYSNPGNGLTFFQAYDPVNASVQTVPGAPWLPTSILGIATEVPAAPLPNYRTSLNETLRLCQQLPGVTVWNSTGVPVFTGTLNSGAAPFWSFIFKNGSGAYLYATNLQGTVQVDPPSATFTNCLLAAGLGSSYIVNPSRDTPAAAQLAYSTYGENFSEKHSPLIQYYVLGNAQLVDPDASPLGWFVDFFRCDLVGVSGLQDLVSVGSLTNGNTSGVFVDDGWLTCTSSNYELAFNSSTQNVTPPTDTGQYVGLPFQVAFPHFPENNTTFYDGWGLLSWMTNFSLLGRSGAPLSPVTASCPTWVPSLSDCPSSASGWFAVLLSQNGAWLDSFPSATNSSNWSIPNVIVSSQDQLVVVAPSSWNLTGDTLEVSSVEGGPTIGGSVDL
ncbi:MAG TPA: hypothetical protein VMG99_07755 [Thermoplasmata archaeon]|nr:hypothetical protein [Thermoplasmata archaeon]